MAVRDEALRVGLRSALNGVTTGESTPLIRFTSVMCNSPLEVMTTLFNRKYSTKNGLVMPSSFCKASTCQSIRALDFFTASGP